MSNELTDQQLLAAQLLALGTMQKQEVIDTVGCSKQTLYNWINKNEKFNAEVDQLRRDFKNFGKGLMEAKLVDAVNGYWKLTQTSNNDMVRAKAYEFFIEHSIGKVSNKTEITVDTKQNKNTDTDLLEQEHQRWIKDMGEVIEVDPEE